VVIPVRKPKMLLVEVSSASSSLGPTCIRLILLQG
jgi:hypothetical protein